MRQTSHIQIGIPGSLSAWAGGNAGVQAHIGELKKKDSHVNSAAADFAYPLQNDSDLWIVINEINK